MFYSRLAFSGVSANLTQRTQCIDKTSLAFRDSAKRLNSFKQIKVARGMNFWQTRGKGFRVQSLHFRLHSLFKQTLFTAAYLSYQHFSQRINGYEIRRYPCAIKTEATLRPFKLRVIRIEKNSRFINF